MTGQLGNPSTPSARRPAPGPPGAAPATRGPVCRFVPPYLLRRMAAADPDAAARYHQTLVLDAQLRSARTAGLAAPAAPAGRAWTVHTAAHGTALPGLAVRAAGDPASGDDAVDEAAYGITGSLALFEEVYGRASYDGRGAPVSLTVHYGRDYDNAFWDGTQLVFGDGDGRVFDRFTKPVDVLGHEFTHAVTEHTAGLAYQGQSGALNESMSDVFAACLKQRLLDQSAADADWLIGAGIFLPGIQARALRDMVAPGTAYDDPALGRDPQVGHFDDYVHTTDDNGGVHLNSGIPNRAFALAARGIGGRSWEGAGAIWYAALTGGQVTAATDFAGFAAATVAVAGDHAPAVRDAWATVGVPVGVGAAASARPGGAGGAASGSSGGAPGGVPAGAPAGVVSVRRTGGFAGRTADGRVDLAADDPRGAEVRDLMDRIDLASVRRGDPHPDMFVYAFDLCGARATVPEQHLTDDLRRLVELLLSTDA